MKWIDVHISGIRARVRCPKCKRLFFFDARSLKGGPGQWKCCPICETKIDGYNKPRTPQPVKAAADEEEQGGTP